MTETEEMSDSLFRLVEYDQGFSYIADGNGYLSREEILNIARIALESHRKCVVKLRGWIARQERK